MRIGLISDIHGNAAHLDRALDLLQQQQVDSILCAGDLVDGADEPEAVINTLQAKQIPCVCGNHDTDKVKDEDDGKHDPKLSADSLRYIEALPFSQNFKFDDKTLLLIHATPWHNGIHVFSYSTKPFLDRILDQVGDTDFVVIGHTHEPMAIQYRDRWILNPGSVHQNRFEDRASVAILNTADFSFDVFDIRSGNVVNIPVVCTPNP
jgi:putative phosphoesterase